MVYLLITRIMYLFDHAYVVNGKHIFLIQQSVSVERVWRDENTFDNNYTNRYQNNDFAIVISYIRSKWHESW